MFFILSGVCLSSAKIRHDKQKLKKKKKKRKKNKLK